MNHGFFTYSLLRYIHSQVWGEVVNVGMLFLFPAQRRVIFLHPTRLKRLTSLYQAFPEQLVKAYLRNFAKKSQAINRDWDLFAEALLRQSADAFIAAEFLPSDDSALQFDEPRTAVLYSDQVTQVAADFYHTYFAEYETASSPATRHNEDYLLRQYKRLLTHSQANIEEYLQPGITVQSDSVSLKSDLVWQNGTTNLVKSIGFDLLDAENINRKSLEYFGRLNFLTKVARQNHYRFDLLISKPQNPELHAAYDQARDILQSSPAPKVIVEEQEIERYTEKTIREIAGE